MKKLLVISAILFVFNISAYAHMGMMGGGQQPMMNCPASQQMSGEGMMQCCQQGQMGQSSKMGGEQQQPMMNCPMMQQMSGQGPMQCGQQTMGQGMMGMSRERMGISFNPWFQHGVTLILQNLDKLELTDEQRNRLEIIRTKYTKDIIRQDAELKIAELDLETLLKEPQIDLANVKDTLKKIESIETQIRYLRIEAFTEARNILTDEQKETLRKLMKTSPSPMMGGMMQGMGGMMGGTTEAKGPMSQKKTAGEVTVIAAFKNPEDMGSNRNLVFQIKFDTHTVSLDTYNINKKVILKSDGKIIKPASVKTSGSGHHREADISFKNPGKTEFVELVVMDLAGVKETVFRWKTAETM